MPARNLQARAIGRVRGDSVVIHKRYVSALDGIEGFSHIIVLFWLDKSRSKPAMKIHPKGRADIPLIGTFATRTPHRFNPIGMTVVRLIRRNGSELKVKGLDAWPGTPVLDIKPYTRRESVRKFNIPGWVRKLDSLETDPLRRYS